MCIVTLTSRRRCNSRLLSYGGKYLNQYGTAAAGGPSVVPPGWDEWHGLVGNSRYYNYTLSINGVAEDHGDVYALDYLTDLLSNRTSAFLHGCWARVASKRPFFSIVAVPACHGPHEPAPQYAQALTNTPYAAAPRTPNYGPDGATGKHWFVGLEAAQWKADAKRREAFTDWEHVRRLEALLSVDDLVARLLQDLADLKELDRTFVFYTSDHGYHLGQFGLLKDKRMPYDFDIRVPAYVRGPGLPQNVSCSAVTLSIDLAPTFLDIGGGGDAQAQGMDGRSALLTLRQAGSLQPEANRSFLVEYHGESYARPEGGQCDNTWAEGLACWPEGMEPLAPGPFAGGLLCSCQDSANNTYACVRTLNATADTMYCEFKDRHRTVEYYDLSKDPWQMDNRAHTLGYEVRTALSAQLARFRSCTGGACTDL